MGANYEKGLYRQYEEAVALLEKMNAKMEAMEHRYQQEIAEMKAAHQAEVAKLNKALQERDERIRELTARNEALTEEVTRLKSIINNDSNNSSNSPSSDQNYDKKANNYNLRSKSGKKQGAQKGHKGVTLTKKDVENILSMEGCEHRVKTIGKVSDKYVTRYVVSVRVVPTVTEYHIYQNDSGKFSIPGFLRSEVTYGDEIRAMVIALYGIGVVSIDRIADFMHGITKGAIRMASGTVYHICRCFADKAASSLQDIACGLMNEEVVYTDATVVTVCGKQSYIRNISTKDAVMYYGMPKKTLEEMEKLTVLKSHTGTMVHDHETALYRFPAMHAECNVHILRYLRKNFEDTGNDWGERMSALLTRANNERKLSVESGAKSFSNEEIGKYEQEYDEILVAGFEQNVLTKPKWAQKAERALLRRMEKYKANHLLFLRHFEVGFDNNLSERDLRKCKNRQKMAGGFRTQEGCGMFCDILSVIETAKRRSINVFDVISKIFHGETLFSVNVAAEL